MCAPDPDALAAYYNGETDFDGFDDGGGYYDDEESTPMPDED